MTDLVLEELRERFRDAARVRLEEMRGLLASVDAAAVPKIARHFHAFAGLGATYGFREVSELGDDGEASILPLTRSGALPSEPVIDHWRTLCDRIEHALERGDVIAPPATERGERRRVLAVDDDATQGVFLEHVLETAGYDVRVCADAQSCREALETYAPDILLVDIHLGDCDRGGYQLVEEVRAGGRFRDLPVIYVSADREVEPGSTDPHLVKPVDWTALLALIRSLLA